jgi:DNA polymerase elongation subunit (family B)
LNTNSLIDNLTEIENIKNFINSEINNFVNLFLPPQFAVNHNLRLDIEKIYSSLLLLDVKKRYFGRLKYLDGKNVNDIHYMGLDLKKSSTSIIARDIQYELCLTLLNSSDIYSTLSNAYNKVTSCFDINSFKLPSKLNKNASDYKVNSPTLRGVAWSNSNLSTHFKNGDKFYIIYVIPSSKIKTDVIAFENLEQLSHITFQIDKHKYLLDVYRKINNVIRGIPKLKYLNDGLYIRTKSHSRNLSDFFN